MSPQPPNHSSCSPLGGHLYGDRTLCSIGRKTIGMATKVCFPNGSRTIRRLCTSVLDVRMLTAPFNPASRLYFLDVRSLQVGVQISLFDGLWRFRRFPPSLLKPLMSRHPSRRSTADFRLTCTWAVPIQSSDGVGDTGQRTEVLILFCPLTKLLLHFTDIHGDSSMLAFGYVALKHRQNCGPSPCTRLSRALTTMATLTPLRRIRGVRGCFQPPNAALVSIV